MPSGRVGSPLGSPELAMHPALGAQMGMDDCVVGTCVGARGRNRTDDLPLTSSTKPLR